MKQRGHTVNGPVLRFCRERLLADRLGGKPTIAKASALIDVTPALWSQWELGGRRISNEKLALLVDLFDLSEPAPLLASTAIAAEAEAERQRVRRTVGSAA